MAELLIPADAATLAIQHLGETLDVPARSAAVVDAGLFLQVRDTGGTPRDDPGAVNVHQLTITAWGRNPRDDLDALELAGRALAEIRRAELVGWLRGTPCSAVQVLSLPYLDPDPGTRRARYTFTCRLHLRATATTT